MDIDSYCPAPFRHLAHRNHPSIGYRPCCGWRGDDMPNQATAQETFLGPWMDQLRAQMLRNEPHAGCVTCYKDEQYSGHSLRTGFMEWYGRPTEPVLQDLEYNLGNLCNMKCRMCGSLYSSKWMTDDRALRRTVTPLIRRKVKDLGIDLSVVERIKFIVGEPTLEHEEIAEMLTTIRSLRGSLAHMRIEIATNAMEPFDETVMDLLLQCGLVDMTISIDGMESSNTYQRTFGDWTCITSNAKFYDSLYSNNFHLGVNSTFTIFTLHEATDLIDYVSTELPSAWHLGTVCEWPQELAVCNLPESYKQQMTDQIRQWQPRAANRYSEILRSRLLWALSQPRNLPLERIREHVKELDALRSEDLEKIMPDLHAVLWTV